VAQRQSNRQRRPCTRYTTLPGSFTLNGKAGSNKLLFRGRLNGRRLSRGRYRLLVTPSVDGQSGTPAFKRFRIR
jgi:hypothetical protein